MSNSFGSIFKITTFGESHGLGIGVVIDGCPPSIKISAEEIQAELNRRRPGQSKIVTPRDEKDRVEILSGIFEGRTTGTPIALIVLNKDQKSRDYRDLKNAYRPSHADFTYEKKYGIRDYRGGGRASARETIARVAAGAIAKKILATEKVEILAYVQQVYDLIAEVDPQAVSRPKIESNIVRCPNPKMAKEMIALIERMKSQGDSMGGIIECIIKNPPIGLGSPVFNKLEARLAQAMLSLPATKGFEVGEGFNSVLFKGSEHNDPFTLEKGKVKTLSNHSGGIQGGISNGMPIIFRVAFKPTSTILREQQSVTRAGKQTKLKMAGRHDPCVVPRAVPIVEAMAALVLVDELLIQKTVQ